MLSGFPRRKPVLAGVAVEAVMKTTSPARCGFCNPRIESNSSGMDLFAPGWIAVGLALIECNGIARMLPAYFWPPVPRGVPPFRPKTHAWIHAVDGGLFIGHKTGCRTSSSVVRSSLLPEQRKN